MPLRADPQLIVPASDAQAYGVLGARVVNAARPALPGVGSGFDAHAGGCTTDGEREEVKRDGLVREVEAIARALVFRRTRRRRRSPSGRPVTSRSTHPGDELDLDRAVELLAERTVIDPSEVPVRTRRSSRRATVLILDVSGSMTGEKFRVAAATVAALQRELRGGGDELAVVAFWSDAAILARFGEEVRHADLLTTLATMATSGLTNVEFALRVAAHELRRSAAADRRAVLVSDCVHNAGPDPRLVAGEFSELHVILEADGEVDRQIAHDLARLGRGTWHAVVNHRQVSTAINRIFEE